MQKRYVRRAATAVFFLVCVFAVAEIYVRIQERRNLSAPVRAGREYQRTVVGRVHDIWLDVFRDADPLLPPYLVFANRGMHDEERTQAVLDESRLSFVGTRTSYDFLQDIQRASSTSYSVTVNTLGFRDPERSAEKPRGTYRVIALGSYHTFGLGVDDDETYPAFLEDKLQQLSRRPIEVWNGGKPAGTAIIGLAQMRHEVLEYDPDLLIIDYGFIDTLIIDDNIFPPAMRFPDSLPSKIFRVVLEPVVLGLNHSVLWQNFHVKFLIEKPRKDKTERFQEIIGTILDIAQENRIPVVILSQLQVSPQDTFDVFASRPEVHVVKVRDVFAERPPLYPGHHEWKEGYWAGTWLYELNPDLVDVSVPFFEYYPYRLNLFQLNSKGQEAVAAALVDLIYTSYLKK